MVLLETAIVCFVVAATVVTLRLHFNVCTGREVEDLSPVESLSPPVTSAGSERRLSLDPLDPGNEPLHRDSISSCSPTSLSDDDNGPGGRVGPNGKGGTWTSVTGPGTGFHDAQSEAQRWRLATETADATLARLARTVAADAVSSVSDVSVSDGRHDVASSSSTAGGRRVGSAPVVGVTTANSKVGDGKSKGKSRHRDAASRVRELEAAIAVQCDAADRASARIVALEAELRRKDATLVALSAGHADEKAALRKRIRALEADLQNLQTAVSYAPLHTGGGRLGDDRRSGNGTGGSSVSVTGGTKAPGRAPPAIPPLPSSTSTTISTGSASSPTARAVASVYTGADKGAVVPHAGFGGALSASSSPHSASSCSGCVATQRQLVEVRAQLDTALSTARTVYPPGSPARRGRSDAKAGFADEGRSGDGAGAAAGVAAAVEQELDKGSAALVSDVVNILRELDARLGYAVLTGAQPGGSGGASNGTSSPIAPQFVVAVNRFLTHITALREALSLATAQVGTLECVCLAKDAVIEGLKDNLRQLGVASARPGMDWADRTTGANSIGGASFWEHWHGSDRHVGNGVSSGVTARSAAFGADDSFSLNASRDSDFGFAGRLSSEHAATLPVTTRAVMASPAAAALAQERVASAVLQADIVRRKQVSGSCAVTARFVRCLVVLVVVIAAAGWLLV